MFAIGEVALRPLERDDLDQLYRWFLDPAIELYGGWIRRRSRAAFMKARERLIEEPADDMVWFGILAGEALVGHIQLARIDQEHRTAAVGIGIGEKTQWGRGIGRTAVRILLDYAFTARNLERVYAEVYGFNERSQRMLLGVGMRREGILRQHEVHNGARQDMHIFGILKPEFYERYETIFRLPGRPEERATG